MKNFSVKTKENFHHSSKERVGKKYILWIIGVVFALVFLRGAVESVTSGISATLFSIRNYFHTSSATVPVFLRSRNELSMEIQELKQQLASSKGLDVTIDTLTQENEELRALLGASSTPRIVAGVVGRPPFTPYDTVVLDQGSDDGIVEYAPVFVGNNRAIGYVRKVFSESALVTLFSSPDVETTVYIFDSHIFTTAYGIGGGVVHLSVPQGVSLSEGSVVVLPSLDGGILGTVDEVQSIPTEPEQHAYVTLGMPLQGIHFVAVGAQPVEERTFADVQTVIDREEQKRFIIDVPETERLNAVSSTTQSTTTEETASTTP